MIDLVGFAGNVLLVSNTFTSNTLMYQSCDQAYQISSNDNTAFLLNDNYPNFGSSKTKVQIKSVISIVQTTFKVEIAMNTFTGNSGTKGIIYIDSYDRGTTLPVVVAYNTFQQNAGYVDAGVIYVRARGRNGMSILTTNPDDTNYFCAGYHFEGNSFVENLSCPRSGGAIVKMECVDYSATSSLANDRITPGTLSSSRQSSWYAMGFTYTAAPLTATYTYSGVSKTITGDMKQVTFRLNTFTANSATGKMGIVDLQTIPKVVFDTETYTNNGDSTSNSISTYGSGVLTAATSSTIAGGEMSIDLALAS